MYWLDHSDSVKEKPNKSQQIPSHDQVGLAAAAEGDLGPLPEAAKAHARGFPIGNPYPPWCQGAART